MPDLSELETNLGVSFNDKSLLEHALIHSSYLNENPGLKLVSNERLEFLGDAVLGLVAAEKLYSDFPGSPEGELTRLRAALVRKETLARLARKIGLGDFLYLGKGEEGGGGRSKPANLASGLEAVLAAIYLDQGMPAAEKFILRLLDAEVRRAAVKGRGVDRKSALQELAQARGWEKPVYEVIEASGPDHARTFVIAVSLRGKEYGRGSGQTKKAAETEAAGEALKRLSASFTE